MPEFAFDVKLMAAIRVIAPDEKAARAKLAAHLDSACSNFGAWEDSGDPITGEASMDGDADLYEIDGESV